MYDCEATGVKDCGERAWKVRRIKRIETVARGRLKDRGHILAS